MQTINTISSQNMSFIQFLGLIAMQPNAVLEQAKQIVIRNPDQMFDSEVIIRVNQDERAIELKEGDIPFDKVVLAKTEKGINMGLQRVSGNFPQQLFQSMVSAFQTARLIINWGSLNHAKGQYLGGVNDDVRDYDLYYEGVILQLSGTMPFEPGKRAAINAINWEQITTPNGQVYLHALTQKGQVIQTRLQPNQLKDKTPEQVVQAISFDQVQLPKGDKVVTFVTTPNGNDTPNLLVGGNKAVYWNGQQVGEQQIVALSFNASSGMVGMVTQDRRYFTAQVQGNNITPLQVQGDQLSEDYQPMFKTGPQLLIGPALDFNSAIIGTVQKQGQQTFSVGRFVQTRQPQGV